MTYDFDHCIDRRRSDSAKWRHYDEDVLPLWVADMDFAAPEPVTRALQERVAHGIFGYALHPPELREVIQERLARLYGWQVETNAIIFLPGVVSGFNLACHALACPGSEILVEPPVYPPMLRAPGNAGCTARLVPLLEGTECYEHDYDAFEQAITERTTLFLLCNPHNPVGRVFERGELERLADMCLRHRIAICSDEIHCDIVFRGHRHIPIASLAPEIAAQTVTLLAPSKTYNIAGLCCAVGIVQNAELRATLRRAAADLVPDVNLLGFTAALAAYRDGQAWLDDLLAYLEANHEYLVETVARELPSLHCRRHEGTFLAWIDCRKAGIAGNPQRFFLEQARVALGDGLAFGPGGEGFVRLNFGCRRAVLAQALDRMRAALDLR